MLGMGSIGASTLPGMAGNAAIAVVAAAAVAAAGAAGVANGVGCKIGVAFEARIDLNNL